MPFAKTYTCIPYIYIPKPALMLSVAHVMAICTIQLFLHQSDVDRCSNWCPNRFALRFVLAESVTTERCALGQDAGIDHPASSSSSSSSSSMHAWLAAADHSDSAACFKGSPSLSIRVQQQLDHCEHSGVGRWRHDVVIQWCLERPTRANQPNSDLLRSPTTIYGTAMFSLHDAQVSRLL